MLRIGHEIALALFARRWPLYAQGDPDTSAPQDGPTEVAPGLGGESPFASAPLPFESLKAPPDTAFDIVMTSAGVFLLAFILIGAFLALSKLGTIEEILKREAARRRDEEAAGEPLGAEELQAAITAATTDGLARIEAAIARTAEGGDPSMTADDLRESLAPLVGEFIAAREKQDAALLARIEALRAAVESAPARTVESAAGSGEEMPPPLPIDREPTTSVVLDRVHTRLAALGFTDIEVVTPRAELDAERLTNGELRVEARRAGSIHKGTVTLEDGAPADVRMRPSHTVFP